VDSRAELGARIALDGVATGDAGAGPPARD
jgi:hypothetical protein